MVFIDRTSFRWGLRAFWLGLVLAACLQDTVSAQNAPATETLGATFQRALVAFHARDYGAALAGFEALETVFGTEPEFAELLPSLLPVWGYSALQSAQYERAVALFGRFLEDYPDKPTWRDFVQLGLAEALRAADRPEAAIRAYEHFIDANPDQAEAMLSRFKLAELQLEHGQIDAGLDRLQAFSELAGVPGYLRAQARLRALQACGRWANWDRALVLLFDFDWQSHQTPEVIALSTTALQLGERLLAAGRADAALMALRWVLPRRQLLVEQSRRLEIVRAAHGAQARAVHQGGGPQAMLWSDYWSALIAHLEAQLETFVSRQDHTPGLQIRVGQALLQLERFASAWVLFRALTQDESLPEDVRAAAHFRWLLAAHGLEEWDEVNRIAEAFWACYPDDPAVPRVRFVVAQAAQHQQRHAEAVQRLSDLLEDFPDHPLAAQWRFSRGLNHALDRAYPEARADFSAYLEKFPQGRQRDLALLWQGLTNFFDRDYDGAIARFDEALASLEPTSPVYPEVHYHRANACYAKRDFTAALRESKAFTERFPRHRRADEMRALGGDCLTGLGQWEAALAQFSSIGEDAGAAYVYAVFQQGKILRLLERYDALIAHFERYASSGDNSNSPRRLAEALYWVGWAYDQQDRPAAALRVVMASLTRLRDNAAAGEVTGLLEVLERRFTSATESLRGVDSPEPVDHALRGLMDAPTFASWLEAEAATASSNSAWTWFGRVRLYQAHRARLRRDPARANIALLDVVAKAPVSELDAATLAAVGDHLLEQKLGGAEPYFQRLLERFPESPHGGAATYGLARLALDANDARRADRYLDRFWSATPGHRRAHAASLLHGEVLIALDQPEAALKELEALLRERAARGRTHARALLLMARAEEARARSDRAVAYYQRVFNAYRAYPDLTVQAYLGSAACFEQLGDTAAALATLEELHADDRLRAFPGAWAQAGRAIHRLQNLPLDSPENASSLQANQP